MKALISSPFVSAACGGLTVAIVFLVLGITGRRTTRTVIEQGPISAQAADRDLTPHDIYVRDAPGVVFVRSTSVSNAADPFNLYPSSSVSTGSGFLVDNGGHKWILTNYHVIEGAQSVTIQFEDSVVRTATIVGRDPNDDLALLRADLSGVSARPLKLGDSATVQVGDPTLAIGNPFGLDRTLTSGIVSALQREIQAPNKFAIDNVIQTDAPINPGNSGGPLIDAAGRVIGINSQIATGSSGSGSVGIGFAVPIDTAKRYLPQLEHGSEPQIAYLGVTGVGQTGTLRGVVVQQASSGGPAAAAGLKRGQVIESLDGHSVSSMGEVKSIVEAYKPGQTITVKLKDGDRQRRVHVTLATRPAQAPTQ
jgi:S1-C subfamily serine protease